MEDKFAREKLRKEVFFTKYDGTKKLIRDNILGIILEFGFFFAFIGWTLFFLIIPNFNQLVFGAGFVMLLILSLFFFYLVFIKFNNFQINSYSFQIPKLKESVSFVLVTDMHIGSERFSSNRKRTKRLVEKINSLNTELVILGGDFVNLKYSEESLSPLKDLKAKYKIGVYGNHDSLYLEQKQQDEFPTVGVNSIESLGIDLLNNENTQITINGQPIVFGGITDLMSLNFNSEKAFENAPKDLARVLIAHSPDIVDYIEEKDDIDLILSGHTHGGQIVLPIIGPIYKLPVNNTQLVKGVFKINSKTNLLVSQGSGHSGTRIRFGTNSEICLITLNP